MELKKILLIGGAGFIGKNFLHFQRKNYSITVLDKNEEQINYLKKFYPELDLICCDFGDMECYKDELTSFDAIIHLSAITRVQDSIINPEDNFNENVYKTFFLINQLKNINFKGKFIFASTGGAILGNFNPPCNETINPLPLSPYGASKLAIEGYLSAYNGSYDLDYISLRFTNIYGPFCEGKVSLIHNIAKKIKKKEKILINGDGSISRDFISTEDIASAIDLAINSYESGVFLIGSGKSATVHDILKIYIKLGYLDEKMIQFNDPIKGEVNRFEADISKAKDVLGFSPKTNLLKDIPIVYDYVNNGKI